MGYRCILQMGYSAQRGPIFAGWQAAQLLKGAVKMADGLKTGIVGDVDHVGVRRQQMLLDIGDALLVEVVHDGHLKTRFENGHRIMRVQADG